MGGAASDKDFNEVNSTWIIGPGCASMGKGGSHMPQSPASEIFQDQPNGKEGIRLEGTVIIILLLLLLLLLGITERINWALIFKNCFTP